METFEFARAIGEQPSLNTATDCILVRNLSATLKYGVDAWGREKPQPVLISVRLWLRSPFTSAADNDAVDGSTIHYGELSKAILNGIQEVNSHKSLNGPLDAMISLIGICERMGMEIQSGHEVEIFFPKGSLMGDGYAICNRRCYEPKGTQSTLRIKGLQVPTVVGVNEHEKVRKQIVVIDVDVPQRVLQSMIDTGHRLEELVVKSVEENTFETLEKMAQFVVDRVRKFWAPLYANGQGIIYLKIEKPSAVAMADAVGVQIARNLALPEWGKKPPPQVPFPLKGTLEEFLGSIDQS